MYCWGALELTAQEKMFKHSNCLLFSFYIYVVITVFVLLQDHLLCDYIDSLPHSFPHMISAVLAISPLFVVLFGRSLQFWDLYFIRKSFLMFLWHNLVGRGGILISEGWVSVVLVDLVFKGRNKNFILSIHQSFSILSQINNSKYFY